MDHIFEIIDKTGRRIRLTKERWQHLAKHPDIMNKLEDLQFVLQHPLKITDYSLDENIKYYYHYFKQREMTKYLRIIVKYLNGEGFIITAYFVETI